MIRSLTPSELDQSVDQLVRICRQGTFTQGSTFLSGLHHIDPEAPKQVRAALEGASITRSEVAIYQGLIDSFLLSI